MEEKFEGIVHKLSGAIEKEDNYLLQNTKEASRKDKFATKVDIEKSRERRIDRETQRRERGANKWRKRCGSGGERRSQGKERKPERENRY